MSLVFTPLVELALQLAYMMFVWIEMGLVRLVTGAHRGLVVCAGALTYSMNLCIMVWKHKLYSAGGGGMFITGVAAGYCMMMVYACAWVIVQHTAGLLAAIGLYSTCRCLRPKPPVVHISEIVRPVMKRPSRD